MPTRQKLPPASLDFKVCDDEGFPRRKLFVGSLPIVLGSVKATKVEDKDGTVEDWRDVTVKGYASTWKNLDRDGETFLRGAFKDTIPQFMVNPIMLRDHRNQTVDAVGYFTVVREDAKGLYVEGVISNAPDCQSLRFKLVEGILKTFSVAGRMHFNDTDIEIFKIDLWEITVTPIPSNPQAVFDSLKANRPDDESGSTTQSGRQRRGGGEKVSPKPAGLRVAGVTIKP